jgi:hypothetical protein
MVITLKIWSIKISYFSALTVGCRSKFGLREGDFEGVKSAENKKGGKIHLFCPKSTMNLTYLCYGFVKVDINLCFQ